MFAISFGIGSIYDIPDYTPELEIAKKRMLRDRFRKQMMALTGTGLGVGGGLIAYNWDAIAEYFGWDEEEKQQAIDEMESGGDPESEYRYDWERSSDDPLKAEMENESDFNYERED